LSFENMRDLEKSLRFSTSHLLFSKGGQGALVIRQGFLPVMLHLMEIADTQQFIAAERSR
jgi:hypothetical protein